MGTVVPFQRVNWTQRESNNSPHLVPRLRMSGATPSFHLNAFIACIGTTMHFFYLLREIWTSWQNQTLRNSNTLPEALTFKPPCSVEQQCSEYWGITLWRQCLVDMAHNKIKRRAFMTTTMKFQVPQNGEFLQNSDLHTTTQLFQLLHYLFGQLVVYCSHKSPTDKASHI